MIAAVKQPGDAKYHKYPKIGKAVATTLPGGDKQAFSLRAPAGPGGELSPKSSAVVVDVHVVHSVGPDLRKSPVADGRPYTRDEALAVLSRAYENTLREFVASGQHVLRLLPISGGIFAGPFLGDMPSITREALVMGFPRLTPEQQREVGMREVHLCIFDGKKDLPEFWKAGFEIVVPKADPEATQKSARDMVASSMPSETSTAHLAAKERAAVLSTTTTSTWRTEAEQKRRFFMEQAEKTKEECLSRWLSTSSIVGVDKEISAATSATNDIATSGANLSSPLSLSFAAAGADGIVDGRSGAFQAVVGSPHPEVLLATSRRAHLYELAATMVLAGQQQQQREGMLEEVKAEADKGKQESRVRLSSTSPPTPMPPTPKQALQFEETESSQKQAPEHRSDLTPTLSNSSMNSSSNIRKSPLSAIAVAAANLATKSAQKEPSNDASFIKTSDFLAAAQLQAGLQNASSSMQKKGNQSASDNNHDSERVSIYDLLRSFESAATATALEATSAKKQTKDQQHRGGSAGAARQEWLSPVSNSPGDFGHSPLVQSPATLNTSDGYSLKDYENESSESPQTLHDQQQKDIDLSFGSPEVVEGNLYSRLARAEEQATAVVEASHMPRKAVAFERVTSDDSCESKDSNNTPGDRKKTGTPKEVSFSSEHPSSNDDNGEEQITLQQFATLITSPPAAKSGADGRDEEDERYRSAVAEADESDNVDDLDASVISTTDFVEILQRGVLDLEQVTDGQGAISDKRGVLADGDRVHRAPPNTPAAPRFATSQIAAKLSLVATSPHAAAANSENDTTPSPAFSPFFRPLSTWRPIDVARFVSSLGPAREYRAIARAVKRCGLDGYTLQQSYPDGDAELMLLELDCFPPIFDEEPPGGSRGRRRSTPRPLPTEEERVEMHLAARRRAVESLHPFIRRRMRTSFGNLMSAGGGPLPKAATAVAVGDEENRENHQMESAAVEEKEIDGDGMLEVLADSRGKIKRSKLLKLAASLRGADSRKVLAAVEMVTTSA